MAVDNVQNVARQIAQQFRTTEGETAKSGPTQGVSGTDGPAPDPAAPPPDLPTSLASFAPVGAGRDFETRLAEITQRLKETSNETQQAKVANDQETKRLNIQENQAKLEAATEKLEDAEATGEAGKIANYVAMAFQALGAVLMVALGAVLIATGAGAALGAALIVGGALLAVSLANSITAEATKDGSGIAGSIAKAFGANDEEAGNADLGFGIGMAVASFIAAAAATVLTGGAAAGAAVASLQSVLSASNAVVGAAGATATAVSASVNVAATVERKEASDMQAEGMDIQGFMQQLDDMIDQALTLLMQSNDRFNAMVDSLTDMTKDTADTMSATRFAG